MSDSIEGTRYEIRLQGVLGDALLAAFPRLDARVDDGDTILTGRLPDRAALHGVLAQIESLNLELVEVRRGQAERSATGNRQRPRAAPAPRYSPSISPGSDDDASSPRAGGSTRTPRTAAPKRKEYGP